MSIYTNKFTNYKYNKNTKKLFGLIYNLDNLKSLIINTFFIIINLLKLNNKLINLNITIFTLIFNVGFKYAHATTLTYNELDIIQGTHEFLTQEILKQHKTVDVNSINIKILNLEPINNKICSSKINYYFPIHSNINQKATVIAECHDYNHGIHGNNWKVYIPVSIKFFVDAISVKKSLPKLHVINREDLTIKKINVITLKNSYYANLDEVIGLVLNTSIKQDTVLTSNLLTKIEHGA